jgi:predicted ATPase
MDWWEGKLVNLYPLLLVFEDLQWADHSTVDLISALARRRSPSKLMLIGTYLPVDVIVSEHPLNDLKRDLLLISYVARSLRSR